MAASPMERALGTGSFLKLRGKTYQCSRIRLRHFAEAKAFLMALAPDPLQELRGTPEEAATFDGFPPEVQKALALKALELKEERKKVAHAEAAHWINGAEGVLFFFWVMVRNHHPEFHRIEDVFQAFPPDKEEDDQSDPQPLSIGEAVSIQQKVDELSFGGDVEKKASPASPGRREKKVKKKKKR